MGGGDLLRQSEKASHYLANLGFEVSVILGPYAEDFKVRSTLIKKYRTPKNFFQIMAQSVFAFVNAGSTLFECNYLGVPTIILPQSDNEKRMANYFLSQNWTMGIGLKDYPFLSKKFTNSTASIIDGKGAKRVMDIILSESEYER